MGETVTDEPEPRPDDDDLRPGDVLGDYVLLEKLGEGGQGVVWKASPQHSREIVVALKTLRGPASGDLASVYRLRADARAIARMKHAHIIRTFYFGQDRGRWFFVMELIKGGPSPIGSNPTKPIRALHPWSWNGWPGRFITPTPATRACSTSTSNRAISS